jgi:hypothetical protein
MDGRDQQYQEPQQPTAYPRIAHQKILQPADAFVQEVRASQQQSTDQPQPMPQGTVQAAPQANTQPRRPTVPVNSIYPDATSGVDITTSITASPAPSDEPQTKRAKSASKLLVVRIVAVLIILTNAGNAYASIHNALVLSHAGTTNWLSIINIIEVCGLLGLAVGILLLNEAARATYVLVSAMVLVLTCISLFNFYSSTRSVASSHISTAQTKSMLEKSLSRYNPTLTPEQNNELHQSIQKQLNDLSGSPTELGLKQYLSEGLLVVVAIGPIIFLTRPAIKEVFR